MTRRIIAVVFVAAVTAATGSYGTVDQLIVFTQPGVSALARSFEQEHLPEITGLAEKLSLELRVVDVSTGAPAEVTITPLIVFQNHRGRSIFQGRYTETDKITHFIRTSRAVPQGQVIDRREDQFVWRNGRTVIVSNIKITPLTGTLPADFSQETFSKGAMEVMARASVRFNLEAATVRRSDRSFYLDFYPYRSEEGRFFISVALYSQFNCAVPIYTQLAEPINGDWEKREMLLADAFAALENEVVQQISSSEIGDGFDPIADTVPVVTWESLGLALPEAPVITSSNSVDFSELATNWTIEPPASADEPRMHLRFLPPMDSYSGEATEIRGEFHLTKPASLEGANGWLEVDMASITTGDAHLDEMLRDQVIRAYKFPTASFRIEKIEAPTPGLVLGELNRFAAHGEFELKGVTVPLTASAQVQPVIGKDNKPRLHFRATATIRLKEKFQIEGPLGPEPANDTLIMYLNLMMRPNDDPPQH